MTEERQTKPEAPACEDIPLFAEATPGEMRRLVEALYHVHRLIAAITDIDTLLERITEESKNVARAEASSLMLYDPATDELYFHVALGESGDQEALKREIRLQMGQGIAGITAANRTSILVEDAQKDPRLFRGADATTQFTTRSLLAVPMLDHDRLLGVLEVLNKTGGGPFTPLNLQALEMFSSLAASSLANARLIEEQIRTARLAAVGQAVTGLSHYTKNIVTGLTSSADLIEMGIERGNLDVLNRTWPLFKRSTKRISNFVQDMLSFSKPRIPLREACQLADVIQEACGTFAELFAQKVEVRIDPSGLTAPVQADAQALYRALLNLVVDAADAVDDGTGIIAVHARTLANGTTEVTVDDNGPGVPPENRPKIFDPFFSTKGAQGTGLGLAVTQKVIKEHGGGIAVEDSPEGGARFRISLPPTEEPAEEPKAV